MWFLLLRGWDRDPMRHVSLSPAASGTSAVVLEDGVKFGQPKHFIIPKLEVSTGEREVTLARLVPMLTDNDA